MALEISEIGIRLVIGEPSRPPASQPPATGVVTLSPQQMESLVQSCTQQVLQTLRWLEER